MTIGTFFIYGLFRLKFKQPLQFIKEYDKKQFWFLILLTFIPFVIHTVIGLVYGSDIRPRWGYVFWYMLGIMLFYFLPCKIEKKEFNVVVKCVYFVMLIIFISFGTLLTVEKTYRSRMFADVIWSDLNKIWSKQFDTPLKYVGGDSEWSFPMSIYGNTHPINVMDTFGYKNPWIDEEDLKKHGVIILHKNRGKMGYESHLACHYLSEDYPIDIKEYKFVLYNALGQPRDYKMYYVIIPPMK